MMADSYESQFRQLLDEIYPLSAKAAEKLLELETSMGARAAFYAAFVIVCLEARAQQTNYRIVSNLHTGELSNFTFFEFTKDNPQAITEFSEVLGHYQADCKRRFYNDRNSPASV